MVWQADVKSLRDLAHRLAANPELQAPPEEQIGEAQQGCRPRKARICLASYYHTVLRPSAYGSWQVALFMLWLQPIYAMAAAGI